MNSGPETPMIDTVPDSVRGDRSNDTEDEPVQAGLIDKTPWGAIRESAEGDVSHDAAALITEMPPELRPDRTVSAHERSDGRVVVNESRISSVTGLAALRAGAR